MNFRCDDCGAPFNTQKLNEAIKNKESTFICPYCGCLNELNVSRKKHIEQGFDALSIGDFKTAKRCFAIPIDAMRQKGKKAHRDAYLGRALAAFKVQVVFDDDDDMHVKTPKLTCRGYNHGWFVDSMDYQETEMSLRKELQYDQTQLGEELSRLNAYVEYIDGVKDAYDELDAKGGKYSLFIASAEDKYEDANDRVRNHLPDVIIKNQTTPIFFPDSIEGYGNDAVGDAKILYALRHAKCMLVVADTHSARMNAICEEFYDNNGCTKQKGANLAYVHEYNNSEIRFPNNTIARNYHISDSDGFNTFVCEWNNVVLAKKKEAEPIAEPQAVAATTEQEAVMLPPDSTVYFGHYPQKREESTVIVEEFAKYGKPTPSDDKGWTVLLVNKAERPYAWYRDEVIRGKKYRAVYFTRFRDVYSLQDSDVSNNPQRANGYMPLRIYCFSFDPITWNIKAQTSNVAELVADRGLDSREFNSFDMYNEWEGSSLHEWLNGEFMETAFSEEERGRLCWINGTAEEDRVYLLDRRSDKDFYEKQISIGASDYFKCLGGMGTGSVNSFWITDSNGRETDQASVMYHSEKNNVATEYVDCTTVAVLPKIVISLV